MKVEWKKFSEEEPAPGTRFWLIDADGEMHLATDDWRCGDDLWWAPADDLPEPPEKEKKWRLKEGVVVKQYPITGRVRMNINECIIWIGIDSFKGLFEEVME